MFFRGFIVFCLNCLDDREEAPFNRLILRDHPRPLIGCPQLDELPRLGELSLMNLQESRISTKVRTRKTFVRVRAGSGGNRNSAKSIGESAMVYELFEHL